MEVDVPLAGDSKADGGGSHGACPSQVVDSSAEMPNAATPQTWPPQSLQAWRFVPPDIGVWGGHARSLWNPLEAFFEERGYRLFVLASEDFDVPKNPAEIRTPDPHHVFIGDPIPSRFYCTRNKLCAATRLLDGTHVVLQLLAIGKDGLEEVEIQKRLHEQPISTKFRNRATPLLQLITYEQENMVFGVFPLLGPGMKLPSQVNPKEALETCYQWMEAVAYLHANLVAHLVRALQPVPSNSPSHELILGAQDIGPEEFLLNYAGPVDDPRIGPLEFLTYEFYSHFSQQWYITDFGVSFVFDPQTESTQRMVVGLGGGKIRNSIADYPKMLGPEVWLPENQGRPYCPFKHDVYQLGRTMQTEFLKLARKYPDLDQIFKSMTDHNPQNRPSMAQVMQSMEVFLTSLTEEDLVSDDYWSSRRNPWIPEHIEFYQRLAKGVDAGLVT